MTQNPKQGTILCVCTVLAAALLFVGAAEAGLWAYRTPTDPNYGTDSLGVHHSDVPPGWAMNRPDPAGQMGPAVRAPSVSFDPTIGHIRESYTQGGVEIQPPLVADLDEYSKLLTTRTYRRLWRDHSKESRSVVRGGVKKSQGMFHVELPYQIPKALRGLLGNGAPNLDVSGSETITLSGVSDWTVRPKGSVTELIKVLFM